MYSLIKARVASKTELETTYTLDEALQMVLSGEIVDAKTQIGLFKYQALHNAGRI